MDKFVDFSGHSVQLDKHLQKIGKPESGQGLVEYAMIFSLVVVLLIVLLYFFGDRVEYIYQSILDTIRSL